VSGHGWVRQRLGRAGAVWLGEVRLGRARQAGLEEVRCVTARIGMVWQAWLGTSFKGQDKAGYGMAWQARLELDGQ